MGLRACVLVLLLGVCALAQIQLQDMQRESRWLRMSAEKLYTFTPAPFGPDWQNTQNDHGSFLKRARQFERAWMDHDATLDTTRGDYKLVRSSFDKIKLFARLNMNAQEVDTIEHMLERLDVIYGINPVQEATP